MKKILLSTIVLLPIITAITLLVTRPVFAANGYAGLSLGTPGLINLQLIGASSNPGWGLSVGIIPVLLSDEDDKDSNEETDFLGTLQFSIPIFLYRSEKSFAAIEPLVGGAYYAPANQENGHWLYAGGSFQFCISGFFMEMGAGYGPSKNYPVLGGNKWNVLFNIGYVTTFKSGIDATGSVGQQEKE